MALSEFMHCNGIIHFLVDKVVYGCALLFLADAGDLLLD